MATISHVLDTGPDRVEWQNTDHKSPFHSFIETVDLSIYYNPFASAACCGYPTMAHVAIKSRNTAINLIMGRWRADNQQTNTLIPDLVTDKTHFRRGVFTTSVYLATPSVHKVFSVATTTTHCGTKNLIMPRSSSWSADTIFVRASQPASIARKCAARGSLLLLLLHRCYVTSTLVQFPKHCWLRTSSSVTIYWR